MKIYQSISFERKIRKFSKKEKNILDLEIKKIIESPSLDEEKKGDLRGMSIHKFKIKTTQHLLSYRIINDDLELIMIGPHENYYRELKNYLKTR